MIIVIVGNRGGTNVGQSLERACEREGISAHLCDARTAFSAREWQRVLSWRILGHRPPRLKSFASVVMDVCERMLPNILITTGLAPLDALTLSRIGKTGIQRLNYLTDDPWNPAMSSRWFFDALRHYDCVFTTRRANLTDLINIGCNRVEYLPFGYDPELFCGVLDCGDAITSKDNCDVVFVGAAESDRASYLRSMIRHGYKVVVYGDGWRKYKEIRHHSRGHADPERIRDATRAAKVALCLVRRQNRDGHVMRSLEIAAIGACMLSEFTQEHAELFGSEGECVLYFRSHLEALKKLEWLVTHDEERKRLACNLRDRIVGQNNSYQDRLRQMLAAVGK